MDYVMDAKRQEEEVEVLDSIYDEEEFSWNEKHGLKSIQFQAFVKLPEKVSVQFEIECDDAGVERVREKEQVRVQHLPPVELCASLPADYPSKSPPAFTVACLWLSMDLLEKLCNELDRLSAENEGSEVLFLWTQFLKEETIGFLEVCRDSTISVRCAKNSKNNDVCGGRTKISRPFPMEKTGSLDLSGLDRNLPAETFESSGDVYDSASTSIADSSPLLSPLEINKRESSLKKETEVFESSGYVSGESPSKNTSTCAELSPSKINNGGESSPLCHNVDNISSRDIKKCRNYKNNNRRRKKAGEESAGKQPQKTNDTGPYPSGHQNDDDNNNRCRRKPLNSVTDSVGRKNWDDDDDDNEEVEIKKEEQKKLEVVNDSQENCRLPNTFNSVIYYNKRYNNAKRNNKSEKEQNLNGNCNTKERMRRCNVNAERAVKGWPCQRCHQNNKTDIIGGARRKCDHRKCESNSNGAVESRLDHDDKTEKLIVINDTPNRVTGCDKVMDTDKMFIVIDNSSSSSMPLTKPKSSNSYYDSKTVLDNGSVPVDDTLVSSDRPTPLSVVGNERLFTEREAVISCESTDGNVDKTEKKSFDQRIKRSVSNTSFSSLYKYIVDYNEARVQTEFMKAFFACNICFQDKMGLDCMQFQPCEHTFCKDCVRSYLEVKINDGAVYLIKCPDDSCESDIFPGQVRELVAPEQFARYDSILLATTLETMTDIMLCPRQACQYPVSREPDEKMAVCPECKYVFCVHCKMVYHGVEPCRFKNHEKAALANEYLNADTSKKRLMEQKYGQQRLNNLVDTTLSEFWIDNHSQNCPHCNASIEKSGGCNKMVCWRCSTYFCWNCRLRLDPKAPYKHYSERSSPCHNRLFEGVADALSDNEGDEIYVIEEDEEEDEAVVVRPEEVAVEVLVEVGGHEDLGVEVQRV